MLLYHLLRLLNIERPSLQKLEQRVRIRRQLRLLLRVNLRSDCSAADSFGFNDFNFDSDHMDMCVIEGFVEDAPDEVSGGDVGLVAGWSRCVG